MKLQADLADLDEEESPITVSHDDVVGSGQPPPVSNDGSLTLPATCCEQRIGPNPRSTLR
jgi:hypothetical protein